VPNSRHGATARRRYRRQGYCGSTGGGAVPRQSSRLVLRPTRPPSWWLDRPMITLSCSRSCTPSRRSNRVKTRDAFLISRYDWLLAWGASGWSEDRHSRKARIPLPLTRFWQDRMRSRFNQSRLIRANFMRVSAQSAARAIKLLTFGTWKRVSSRMLFGTQSYAAARPHATFPISSCRSCTLVVSQGTMRLLYTVAHRARGTHRGRAASR